VKISRRAACVLVSALLVPACSQPAPVKPPPSRPPPAAQPNAEAQERIFRLPAGVRPTRERVELEVVPDRESFSGRVEIALELSEPREDLWISARELTITEATLAAGGAALALRVEPDDRRGAARLVPPRRVAAGQATLALAFRGAFNPRLVGLYRVKARDRWYAYTQFEAIDARRAFPCLDEPAFKIPWGSC